MLVVIVLAGGAGFGTYLQTHAIRSHRNPAPTPTVPVAAALTQALAPPPSSAAPAPGAEPRPAAVARALASAAASPALGDRLLARVIDVRTGTVLYGEHATSTASPASTAKLLTAAAVLTVYPATHRFTTSVVAGPAGTLVLVGGGDPTLTAAHSAGTGARASKPAYPDAARISDLAAGVRAQNVPVSRILVDGSLFTGPAVLPVWAPEDVPSDYGAAITAITVDGGRAAPGDAIRSSAPDLAAGHALAAALGRPGLPVSRGHAPAGTAALASVESAPVSELIAQMLKDSDNVIAETLARMVAVARHEPASFTGAAKAIRQVLLASYGVDVGTGMLDGSGLAARDRLSPATLTALLRVIAGPEHPELHTVLAGLPVAAWSGTLADRFVRGSSAAGAGTVRAKTGTLTSVSALAGVVHDRGGRLLAFALIADRVPAGEQATLAAESALDAVATRLAGCGCG